MSSYPLRNVRVLDLSTVWAGPVASQLLGDMGAEIIKVESRRHIDLMRRLDNRAMEQSIDHIAEIPITFHIFNRNKLSVALELNTAEARILFERLVAVSDVVLDNFSPRVMRHWGLTYETLSEIKPDIIVASLSTAGQWGPMRDVMTYGVSLAAMTGIDTQVGYDGTHPLGSQRAHTDPMSAAFGALAILAALCYRDRTGMGQYIDLSQAEACSTTLGHTLMDFVMNRRDSQIRGNKHRWAAPHGCYRCKGDDKWVAIAVITQEEWHALRRVLGNPDWARDERFEDAHNRKLHENELDRYLEAWTITLDQYDIMLRLQKEGVAAAATLTTTQIAVDPHFVSRGVWTSLPTNRSAIIPDVHWKLSHSQGGIYRMAPALGASQDYVFGELIGMDQKEIAALEDRHVIY